MSSYNNFWQVGQPPSDDVGVDPSFSSFADSLLGIQPPTPSAAGSSWRPPPLGGGPPLRRFGSTGTEATFSMAEKQRKQAAATRERMALEFFVNLLCACAKTNQCVPQDERTASASALPGLSINMGVNTQGLTSHYCFKAFKDFLHVGFELIHYECFDDHDTWSDEFSYALSCYKGKQYTTEQMLALPVQERIALVSVTATHDGEVVMEGDEPKVAAWMATMHNRDDVDGVYSIDDDAYGEYMNVQNLIEDREAKLKEMEDAFNLALNEMKQSPFFQFSKDASKVLILTSKGSTLDVMRSFLNPTSSGFSDVVSQATVVRKAIMNAFAAGERATKTWEQLVNLRSKAVSSRASRPSMLLEVFSDVDTWKPLIDYLDTKTAACMSRVLIGAADRVGGKLVPDPDVMSLVQGRYPHIHIYESVGNFPHVRSGSEMRIHADQYLSISVGFVTTKLRETLRTERLANKYVPPLTSEQKKVDDAKVRAGQTRAFLADERHTQLVADGHDFGFDKDEEKIRVISADIYNRQRLGLPRRRVKNDGWSVHEVIINDDLQYQTTDHTALFRTPPKLKLKLVNADTNELADPTDPYGGLVPDQWLTETGDISLCVTPPNSRVHVPGAMDQGIKELTGNIGTLVRVKPTRKVLTSANNGARFKVVVEAVCTALRSGHPVKLTAQSKELTIVSNPRAKSAALGGKRKERA